MKLHTKIAALALALAATGAQASSITYYSVLNVGDAATTSYSSSNDLLRYTGISTKYIYLPYFDAALFAGATLNSATFTLNAAAIDGTSVTNLNATAITGAIAADTTVKLYKGSTAGTLLATVENIFNSPSLNLAANGNPGDTYANGGDPSNGSDVTQLFGLTQSGTAGSGAITGAGLTPYEGTGNMSMGTTAKAATAWDSPFSNVSMTFRDGARYYATVTYDYTNVPEPASLALLGLGIAGVVAGLRRRAV